MTHYCSAGSPIERQHRRVRLKGVVGIAFTSAIIPVSTHRGRNGGVVCHRYNSNAAPPPLPMHYALRMSSHDAKSKAHALGQKYEKARSMPAKLEPHHWVNLTNGVELLRKVSALQDCARPNIRFMRLQSSHCEASAYDKLLCSLDNDLLLSLAIGRPCYLYDLASRNKLRGVPRALYLGLQFVRWALAYLWFAKDRPHLVPDRVMVRGKNTVPFWQDVLRYRITKDTKKRLRYFVPYVQEMGTMDVPLFGVYGSVSEIDGCMDVHVKYVRQWAESLNCDDEQVDDIQQRINAYGLSVHNSDSTCDELRDIQKQLQRHDRRANKNTT